MARRATAPKPVANPNRIPYPDRAVTRIPTKPDSLSETLMILNRALRRAVRYFPNNTATIHHGRKQTYRELWDRARALSKALSELGAQRGDRIAIYLLNSPQFLEVVYACFEIGAVVVPLNTRLAADELDFIINDADCVAFITDETLRPLAASFGPRLEGVNRYVAVNGSNEFGDYETLIARHINDKSGDTSGDIS